LVLGSLNILFIHAPANKSRKANKIQMIAVIALLWLSIEINVKMEENATESVSAVNENSKTNLISISKKPSIGTPTQRYGRKNMILIAMLTIAEVIKFAK